MKILNIIKGIIIILFFVILAGAYLSLFDNRQLTQSLTLFDLRYVLAGIYVVLVIVELALKRTTK